MLVGACGSVGVINLHEYLLALRGAGSVELRVILTDSAIRFVRPSVIGMFCDQVICSDSDQERGNSHVEAASWAGEFVVLPASANTIGLVANGLCPSLLTCAILARPGPVIFFPNMNLSMWDSPAVQRNVTRLRDDGHVVFDSASQQVYQAGSQAYGRACAMPSPRSTAKLILDRFNAPSSEAGDHSQEGDHP